MVDTSGVKCCWPRRDSNLKGLAPLIVMHKLKTAFIFPRQMKARNSDVLFPMNGRESSVRT